MSNFGSSVQLQHGCGPANASPVYGALPSLARYADRPFGHHRRHTKRLMIYAYNVRDWLSTSLNGSRCFSHVTPSHIGLLDTTRRCYSASCGGTDYCDERVCLCVCMSVFASVSPKLLVVCVGLTVVTNKPPVAINRMKLQIQGIAPRAARRYSPRRSQRNTINAVCYLLHRFTGIPLRIGDAKR